VWLHSWPHTIGTRDWPGVGRSGSLIAERTTFHLASALHTETSCGPISRSKKGAECAEITAPKRPRARRRRRAEAWPAWKLRSIFHSLAGNDQGRVPLPVIKIPLARNNVAVMDYEVHEIDRVHQFFRGPVRTRFAYPDLIAPILRLKIHIPHDFPHLM
jgi:hypothetical protein